MNRYRYIEWILFMLDGEPCQSKSTRSHAYWRRSENTASVKIVFEKRNEFLSLTYPGQMLSFNSAYKKMAITGLIKINMAQSCLQLSVHS